ncbi:putative protein kinase [Plasmopara halstedii]
MKQYSYDFIHDDMDDRSKTKANALSVPENEIAQEYDPPVTSHTPRTGTQETPSQLSDPPTSHGSSVTPTSTPPFRSVNTDDTMDENGSLANTPTDTNLKKSPPVHSTSVTAPDQTTSSSGMSGGSIAGVVVALACVMCVVAAFVIRKKKINKMQSNFPSAFGGSKEVPIVKAKLAPPGSFGKLNSGRNRHDGKEMSNGPEILAVVRDDPFTRRQMHKGGIWDDPVLTAARIPLEQIQIQELIARGGFGQVFMASYKGKTVAVKTLLPETAQDMNEINALFTETKVMAKLEHPCIVRFIGIAWESLSTVCCVTEYLVGGDLRALLNHFLANQTRPRGFDHDKVKIALDIVNGLSYLHSLEPNILHRDLKSRNVLLTSQLEAKLTDFGVSRERSDDRMTNAVGTSLWMAPEVMMGGHYDGKADIFSFGVLLSELDRHDMPYANVKNASGRRPTDSVLLQMVAGGKLQVQFSDNCPEQVLTLAKECISVDPTKRPTAANAMDRLQSALKTFEIDEVAL